MKNRIATLVAIALLLAMFCTACSATVKAEGDTTAESMFVLVEHATSWRIVYHKDTMVMYAVSAGQYNCGTFTLLVNPDGTPMLWEGK